MLQVPGYSPGSQHHTGILWARLDEQALQDAKEHGPGSQRRTSSWGAQPKEPASPTGDWEAQPEEPASPTGDWGAQPEEPALH